MDFTINWLYVVVATLVNIVVGMLWYSPLLLGKPWMAAMGLKKTDIGEAGVSPAPGYLVSTVYAVGQAYLLGLLVLNLPVSGVLGATAIGAGLWLVTSGLPGLRLKFFEDRPWSLYLIDEGNDLVVYLVVAILAAVLA